jgi:hypothetical protein
MLRKGTAFLIHTMKKKTILTSSLILLVAVLIAICLGGVTLWKFQKPQPKPTQETLFEGVEYIRDVRNSPRPIVIHIVKIDLSAPGIRPFVTPGDPDAELPLIARTTSEFLDDFGVQVAINGDGFTPWHSRTIFDYYPHSGDPVAPIGMAASDGMLYSDDTDNEPTLFLGTNNKAEINNQPGKLIYAISGNEMIVRYGQSIAGSGGSPDPRTAVALNQSNGRLILVVVDGRQPGYSEGVTLQELAQIIIDHGGHNAINLDGGGSSTLVVEGPLGNPRVLNSPINNRIPGRERPVGNHLGIFAKPVER